jgi:hypothetical protein
VEVVRIPVYALINVLDSYMEVGSSPGDGLHLYGLTGLHTINQVIACFLICNINLACGEGIRVDCCDVIATTSDYNMTIITLGKLFTPCCLVNLLLPMPCPCSTSYVLPVVPHAS